MLPHPRPSYALALTSSQTQNLPLAEPNQGAWLHENLSLQEQFASHIRTPVWTDPEILFLVIDRVPERQRILGAQSLKPPASQIHPGSLSKANKTEITPHSAWTI